MKYQASSIAAHWAYLGLCLLLLYLSFLIDARSGTDHSLLSEYLKDPSIQSIYQYAGANRFPIAARLGVLYGKDDLQIPVLYIFLKDTGINIRLVYNTTPSRHSVILVCLPGGTIDSGLIEVLKK